MPADAQSMIRKFVPNNRKLFNVMLKVCNDTYKVRYLPIPLVRMLVNKAFEEVRRSGHEVMDNKAFEDKMVDYARRLHPRFRSQLAQLNNRGRRG